MVTECLAAKMGCTAPFLSLTKAKQAKRKKKTAGRPAAVLLNILHRYTIFMGFIFTYSFLS
jgi:hypothetical protein